MRLKKIVVAMFLAAAVFIPAGADGMGSVIINFEDVRDGEVFCSRGLSRGFLAGWAGLSDDAYSGDAALKLEGARNKGIFNMGPDFANTDEGTIDFRMKFDETGGIIIGKAGAINIEFADTGAVRFGLRLKDGWRRCTGETRIRPGHWHRITAAWGGGRMFLFVDGKKEAEEEIPDKIEWNAADRDFMIGSYQYPTLYDSWFYRGIIDNFSFSPSVELVTDNGGVTRAAVPTEEAFGVVAPSPKRRKTSGRVYRADTGEAIAGVAVTDGYTVVPTDGAGRYSIEVSGLAEFIYITNPSGYESEDKWYKPVAPGVDFALRLAEENDRFGIIAVTDTHLSERAESQLGLERFVSEVNDFDPEPVFVVNCGDLMDMPKGARAPESRGRNLHDIYKKIMDNLKMPYYNKAGDHSDVGYRVDEFSPGDPRWGKAMYWEYFGPTYFSFEYGQLHVVVNDDFFGYARRQWLRQNLEHKSPGTAVVFVNLLVDELADNFPEFKNDMLLSLMDDPHIFFYGDNFIYSGALSGTWWNGPCADLAPQGYVILEIDGREFDFFYKGLGEQVRINSPAFGQGAEGMVRIEAHIVTGESQAPLEYSVNGGGWTPMREIGRTMYRVKYGAEWDSTAAPDGLAELAVRTADGAEEHTIPLAVGNLADYKASSGAVLSMKVGSAPGFVGAFPSGVAEVVFNGEHIGNIRGRRAAYSFEIPVEKLRKVNRVGFVFREEGDGFVATGVKFDYGGKEIPDPFWEEVWKVRSNHWAANVVEAAGVLIGDGGIHASSFAVPQNEFNFVLP